MYDEDFKRVSSAGMALGCINRASQDIMESAAEMLEAGDNPKEVAATLRDKKKKLMMAALMIEMEKHRFVSEGMAGEDADDIALLAKKHLHDLLIG
jgi:hypothetical protein